MAKYKYKVTSDIGGSCTVPPGSPFYLEYKKGKRSKALKGSLGVMVFPTRGLAVGFLYAAFGCVLTSRIKRVIPIGPVTMPKWVSRHTMTADRLEQFNKMNPTARSRANGCYNPPKGTECYPEVLVVD